MMNGKLWKVDGLIVPDKEILLYPRTLLGMTYDTTTGTRDQDTGLLVYWCPRDVFALTLETRRALRGWGTECSRSTALESSPCRWSRCPEAIAKG